MWTGNRTVAEVNRQERELESTETEVSIQEEDWDLVDQTNRNQS